MSKEACMRMSVSIFTHPAAQVAHQNTGRSLIVTHNSLPPSTVYSVIWRRSRIHGAVVKAGQILGSQSFSPIDVFARHFRQAIPAGEASRDISNHGRWLCCKWQRSGLWLRSKRFLGCRVRSRTLELRRTAFSSSVVSDEKPSQCSRSPVPH